MLVSLVVETRHWSWTMFSTFVPNNGSLQTNSTHKIITFPFHPHDIPHPRDIPILLVSTTMGDIQWSMVVKFAESKPIEQWPKTLSQLVDD